MECCQQGRVTKAKDESNNDGSDSTLCFDESKKVPVETIYLDPETATGLNADEL